MAGFESQLGHLAGSSASTLDQVRARVRVRVRVKVKVGGLGSGSGLGLGPGSGLGVGLPPLTKLGRAWPGLGLGSGSGLGRGLGLGYWLEVINGPLPELSSSACILRSLALVS